MTSPDNNEGAGGGVRLEWREREMYGRSELFAQAGTLEHSVGPAGLTIYQANYSDGGYELTWWHGNRGHWLGRFSAIEDAKVAARDHLNGIIRSFAALGPSAPAKEGETDATFAEWLAKEMPAGTVIGDPAWWADRIARQYAKRATPAGGGDAEPLAIKRYRLKRVEDGNYVGFELVDDPEGPLCRFREIELAEFYRRLASGGGARVGQEWQPIETAPKDGTEVLLWDGANQHVGYWRDRGRFSSCWKALHSDNPLEGMQLWRHLPAAPAPETPR